MGKVLELINSLQTKILEDGEQSKKMHQEFVELCEDRSAELNNYIKEGKSQVAELRAIIDQETAITSSLAEKIGDLSHSIATDKADLKAATEIRTKEHQEFLTEEKELLDVVDTLSRATDILEKEMRSGGVTMMQINSAKSLSQALDAMVSASMFSAQDASRLTALVQAHEDADDGDANWNLAVPTASAHKSHSSGILETITDLKDKAASHLEAAREKEMENAHNFDVLKQSLEDEMKFAGKALDQAKRNSAHSEEKKSNAQGDLDVTTKTFQENTKVAGQLHHDCMSKARNYEDEVHNRSEELQALLAAEKVLKQTTGGASKMVYGLGQVSLLQVARSYLSTSVDLRNFEVVLYIKDLARREESTELAQLVYRLNSVLRESNESGADPFSKVKGMIRDMIAKLEAEAQEDATKEAFCQQEMTEANAKKDDTTSENEKLTNKVDEMTSRSAKLTEEVATLQKSLSDLAGTQAEMDTMRMQEKASYSKQSGVLEKAIEGVKLALQVLGEFYGENPSSTGADTSGGIIALLQVVEADFSKSLAELKSTEETAAAEYETETKENQIQKATAEQDAKYKSREIITLKKLIVEAKSDRSSVQDELHAVNEYLEKLKKQCVVLPESYAQRKAKHLAEIEGLKHALNILQTETSLLQLSARKRALRGIKVHA